MRSWGWIWASTVWLAATVFAVLLRIYLSAGVNFWSSKHCRRALAVRGAFPGSEFGPSQAEKRSRAGHLLIALDVEVSQPRAAFEARNDGANRRDGLLLPADILADLAKLAGELSIDALGTPA